MREQDQQHFMLIPLPAGLRKSSISPSATATGSSTVARPEVDSARPVGGGWLGECAVPYRAASSTEALAVASHGSMETPARPSMGWR